MCFTGMHVLILMCPDCSSNLSGLGFTPLHSLVHLIVKCNVNRQKSENYHKMLTVWIGALRWSYVECVWKQIWSRSGGGSSILTWPHSPGLMTLTLEDLKSNVLFLTILYMYIHFDPILPLRGPPSGTPFLHFRLCAPYSHVWPTV